MFAALPPSSRRVLAQLCRRPLSLTRASGLRRCQDVNFLASLQTRSYSSSSKKGFKQALASSDVIRYSDHGLLQPKPTKEEREQLAAAKKFFRQGYKFLYSAEELSHHARNEHTPEVVILGASNVGKSSFLNALVGRHDAARVSHRPGKTTTMNAYGVGPVPKIPLSLIPKGTIPPKHSLIIMDTPGYGYKSQAGWGDSIIEYFKGRPMLRGAVVLLSSEKKLLKEDKWVLRTLAESNTRTTVILTKADKNRSEWTTACSALAAAVQEEMRTLSQDLGNGWVEGSGYDPDVIITAANMDGSGAAGGGPGVGSARMALLEMAGYNTKGDVEKKEENIEYSGKVVSFDDICWKT
ncbi:putative GTP-binding protein EngB [Paramyrothecium foliicola]|nr:putative GTP-binding protein EngB [Paramyrothecium foliicola]